MTANIELQLNFSFVIPGSLAGMAMPGFNNPREAEVNFLKRIILVYCLTLAIWHIFTMSIDYYFG